MTIDEIYYTEPELAAKFRQMQETIDRYEAENRKLTEEKEELGGLYNDASLGIGYLEQRCEELEAREKEYKRLLKAAVEDFAVYGALKDLPAEQRVQNPDWRRFNRVFDVLDHQWRFTDEALKLIGEEP